MTNSRVLKITLSLYLIALSFVLIMIYNSATKGYEISLYARTPFLVWGFLLGSIIAGISILVHQAFRGGKTGWLLFGFFLIAVSNLIITSLPALRGYFLYNILDPLAHLGWIKDIIATHKIPDSNFYPATHILIANISNIGNVSPEGVMRYFPALLSVLYMAYMYILASIILRNRAQVLLATAAASPLMFNLFNTSVYPQAVAFFTFPLVIYLYFKVSESNSLSYKALLMLLLVAYPFIHPQAALVLLAFLATMEFLKAIRNRSLSSVSWSFFLIPFIVFFSWISSFVIFNTKLKYAWSVITGGTSLVPVQATYVPGALELNKAGMVQYFWNSYGQLFIYAAVSLIAAVIILRGIKRRDPAFVNPLQLFIWAIVGEIFAIVFFALISAQSISRIFAMGDNAALISPIFVSLALYFLFQGAWTHRIGGKEKTPFWRSGIGQVPSVARKSVPIIIITAAAAVAIFSLYRSPWVFQPNWQVTTRDIKTTEWVLAEKDHKTPISGVDFAHSNLNVVLGFEKALDPNRPDIERSMTFLGYPFSTIPSHFGYESYKTFGEQYTEDFYVVIAEQRVKLTLTDPVLSKQRVVGAAQIGRWDFTMQDFAQLERDPTMNRLYNNGELSVFFLNGIANKH